MNTITFSRDTLLYSGAFSHVYRTDSPSRGKVVLKQSSHLPSFLNELFFLKYLYVNRSTDKQSDFFPTHFRYSNKKASPLYLITDGSKPSLKEYLDGRELSSISLNKKEFSRSLFQALQFLEEQDVVLPNLSPDHIDVFSPDQVRIRDLEQAHFKEKVHQKKIAIPECSYVSPEVILGALRSTSTPLWNAAMITAELFAKNLTPEFSPLSRLIKAHTLLLEKPYPQELVAQANEKGSEFFLQSESDSLETESLSQIIQKNYPEEAPLLIDLLEKILSYVQEERLSFRDILNHPFFFPNEPSSPSLKKEEIDVETLVIGRRFENGSFGTVYQASLNGKQWAIKCSEGTEAVAVLLKEDQILRFLSTASHVIKRLGIVKLSDQKVGIVMEAMKTNLFHYIRERKSLSLEKTQQFTRQIVEALCFLFSVKIAHLDLKTGNILVSDDEQTVKLCDFGASCIAEEISSPSSLYVQTRWYRSPELVLDIELNLATDIWSLGAIMAEMVLGYPIFPVNSTEDLIKAHRTRLQKDYPERLMEKATPQMQEKVRKILSSPPLRGDSLDTLLRRNLREEPPHHALLLTNFIGETFEYDHRNRPVAPDLKEHPFLLQSLEGQPSKKARVSKIVEPNS